MPSQPSLDSYKVLASCLPVKVGKSVEIYDLRLGEGNNLWVKLETGDFITFTVDGIKKGAEGKTTNAFGGLTLSAGPTDWFQLLAAETGYHYRVTLRVTNRGTDPMTFSAGIDCTTVGGGGS
jgi:hypothetical protein